jgi:uncharacterized membrane protein YesL
VAFRGYYSQPGFLTVVNGMAVVYSLPLVFVAVIPATVLGHFAFAPVALAVLLGVMPNPAAAGLQFCAREVARDEQVTIREVRAALSRYWRQAAALYASSFVALVLIVVNIVFYDGMRSPIALPLDMIWIYLLFTWLAVQMYLYPMLLTVERASVPLIYRNALLLAFRRPISTLVVLVMWLLVLVVSSVTGLVLVLGLVVAAIMQQALTLRLVAGLVPRQGPDPRESGESRVGPTGRRGRRRRSSRAVK